MVKNDKVKEEKKPSLIWRFGKFIAGKIKSNSEQRKLNKNPVYVSEPKIESFGVVKCKGGVYEDLERRLYDDSIIALIFGKRGSGKSALGFKLLENIYGKTKRKCFVLGVNQKVMPKWISPLNNIEDATNGGIIMIDEGAIAFGSRESMNFKNRELGKLLAIARHKNLSLFFITQNTGMIDKNVLKLVDTLFVKEGSLLQLEMERTEIRKFYEKAKADFANLEGLRSKYSYVIDADFEGIISHNLPSFWSEGLSKNQG